MEKQATLNQVRALDVALSFGGISKQAVGFYAIWPSFSVRRRNLDQLQTKGLIEWIPAEQTQFEEGWKVTQEGLNVIAELGKKAGVL